MLTQDGRGGERLSLSYRGLADTTLRSGCQEGWLRLSEVKCCRLVTRPLSWQVGVRHPLMDQTEFLITRRDEFECNSC